MDKGLKVCKECQKEKSYSDFHKNKSSRDGVQPSCKDCRNAKIRALYKSKEKLSKFQIACILKKCPVCGVVKDGEEFGPNVSTKDGLQGYCRGCRRFYYEKNKERFKKRKDEYFRRYRQSGRGKANQERYCLKHPEKIRAQQLAQYIPVEGFCQNEECTELAQEKHHLDYLKPLEVVLLCRKCHRNYHVLENQKDSVSKKLLANLIRSYKAMVEKNFNPKTMIKAAILRSAGFPIPENIPDCAWTYREELDTICTDAGSSTERGIISVDVSLKCGAFHWVEGKVTSLPMKVDCD